MRLFWICLLALLSAACAEQHPQPDHNSPAEHHADKRLLEFALSRDETTTLLPTDPKTAPEFWAERDKEIDSVLDHILNGAFEKPADKLRAMVSIDQSLRHLYTVFEQNRSHFDSEEDVEKVMKGLGDRIIRVDTFNSAQLKKMLQGRIWFRDDVDGPQASHNAWLIAQHADRDPDFQRTILKLIEAELGAPGVSGQHYAYLFDRVAGKDGRLQRYGTQGSCIAPETWQPHEIEDPENLDARRASVGLPPMVEYIAVFKDICFEANAPK